MARLCPLLLAILLTGCMMRQPVAYLPPAERRFVLTLPLGPGASPTTVGELLEPAGPMRPQPLQCAAEPVLMWRAAAAMAEAARTL